MELEIIKSKLCWYDLRNTDSSMNEEDKKEFNKENEKCNCDNCFYGRHELANELLKEQKVVLISKSKMVLIEELKQIEELYLPNGATGAVWLDDVIDVIIKL